MEKQGDVMTPCPHEWHVSILTHWNVQPRESRQDGTVTRLFDSDIKTVTLDLQDESWRTRACTDTADAASRVGWGGGVSRRGPLGTQRLPVCQPSLSENA